jgi:hypothetical protein
MSMSNSLPPAGWYPDPEGSFRQRWWSGNNWTNDFAQYRPTQIQSAPPDILGQLRQEPAQSQAPTSPAVADTLSPAAAQYVEPSAQADAYRAVPQAAPQLPSALRGQGAVGTLTREPQTSTLLAQQPSGLQSTQLPPLVTPVAVAPATPAVSLVPLSPSMSSAALAVNPNMMASYEPFGRQSWRGYDKRSKPDVRYTPAGWFVAFVPALAAATVSAVAVLLPLLATWFVFAAVAVSWLAIGFIFAAVDRRTLRLDNHVRTASPVWVLLTPLPYLLARSVRVTSETGTQAHGPLVALILTVVAAAGGLVVTPGLLELILNAPIS